MSGGVLHESLERAARGAAEHPAILAGDDVWTFADLDAKADAFARCLRGRGVRAGDRVAVMLTNRVEFTVVVHGTSKVGAAAVLLSSAWKAAEVHHALALTHPAFGVADGGGVDVLRGELGADAVLDVDVDALTGTDEPLGSEPVRPGDDALFVFSSGTTGMPKAVRHTHGALTMAAEQWADALGLGPDDRFQIATPPAHILGLLNLLAAAHAGATVRLHARFDLDEILRRIESDRITLEMAVAPMALAMANHPDIERFDLSSLRYIMWCATPVTESVARTVTERTGVPFLTAYGASELPVLACNPVDRPADWRLDSAGLAPDGVELRTVDLESGAVVPAGQTGEIQARSATVMAGYLPEDANAEGFTADGWYRTGDVGWLEPEGWVHLTDRSKEMIKVKGFQVAPAEVEAVLHGHPSVLDCAVFGIDDGLGGEVPVAAVQVDPADPVTPEALQQLVADSLATYKQLRHVVIVDVVPRLPSGKVLRRTLRDEWAPKLADAGAR
jgi:long-chain acyl-CoA synthetase